MLFVYPLSAQEEAAAEESVSPPVVVEDSAANDGAANDDAANDDAANDAAANDDAAGEENTGGAESSSPVAASDGGEENSAQGAEMANESAPATPAELAESESEELLEADPEESLEEEAGEGETYEDDDDSYVDDATDMVAGMMATVGIHGYGNWTMGVTTGNNYLFGAPLSPELRNVNAGINFTASPIDRLNVMLAPFFRLDGDTSTAQVDLDFAYAQWTFADWFTLRAGKAKHPFGIYTEFFELGTARPFAALPQGIYGPSEIANKSYIGLGVLGNASVAGTNFGDLGLSWDAYAGLFENEVEQPWEVIKELDLAQGGDHAHDEGEAAHSDGEEHGHDVTNSLGGGGRIRFEPYLEGLAVVLSGWGGYKPDLGTTTWVGSAGVDYQSEWLSLRGEYGLVFEPIIKLSHGYYLEGALRIFEKLQLGLRYDGAYSHVFTPEDIVIATQQNSLVFHHDGGAVISFWLSRQIVVRAEYHLVFGNRFAHPHDSQAFYASYQDGNVATLTNAAFFGTSFSF